MGSKKFDKIDFNHYAKRIVLEIVDRVTNERVETVLTPDVLWSLVKEKKLKDIKSKRKDEK